MKKVASIFLLLILTSAKLVAEDLSPTKSPEIDRAKILDYQKRCNDISNLIIKKSFELECYTNYNHYKATSINSKNNNDVRIANYNLLHPGTSKALFKDYSLVAKIINHYDIVSGLELLATVGHDEQNNKAVLALLKSSPNNQQAAALYRAPGYLEILFELKKLDPSWSLILSPRGDSALLGSVEELVGFFYRGSTATPTINPHCQEVMGAGGGTPVACFITLDKSFMDRDITQHFARRPFMASFQVGDQKITLITSHVVFTYSGNEEAEKDLMKKTFGVENFKELGQGVTSANFARYAEVKNTLDFMNRFRNKYNDRKIMFLADTNLVSNNAFWPEVLKALPGAELFNKEGSTLSPARYARGGVETQGIANDYDHFIFQKNDFSGCSGTSVYNYYKEDIYSDIEGRYVIRQESVGVDKNLGVKNSPPGHLEDDGDVLPDDSTDAVKLEYPLTDAGRFKMNAYIADAALYFKGLYTVRNDEVVQDDFQIKERLEGLKTRVFLRQLTNPYYYRFMQEILSDHLPVAISCKF